LKALSVSKPRHRADGARNQFYENMRAVRPGDVVFSFCDTRIKAIGLVIGVAQSGPKPDFGSAGPNWSDEGWFVPVYYVRKKQIRPKDHIDILRPFLPVKYSPLRPSGDGLQSVYLAQVPEALADALISVIGQAYWDAWSLMRSVENAPGWVDDDELEGDRVSIGPTFPEQIVKGSSRSGRLQG